MIYKIMSDWIIIFTIGVALTSCSKTTVKDDVSKILKDKDSAKWEKITKMDPLIVDNSIGQGFTMTCGYVNGKNGFGGYSGMTPFMHIDFGGGERAPIIISEDLLHAWGSIWNTFCDGMPKIGISADKLVSEFNMEKRYIHSLRKGYGFLTSGDGHHEVCNNINGVISRNIDYGDNEKNIKARHMWEQRKIIHQCPNRSN